MQISGHFSTGMRTLVACPSLFLRVQMGEIIARRKMFMLQFKSWNRIAKPGRVAVSKQIRHQSMKLEGRAIY